MYRKEAEWYYLILGLVIILVGLWSFLQTFLGDPGIPAEIYRRKARPFAKLPQLPPTNEQGHKLCVRCQVYVMPYREHCDLCDVCIDNLDHHCVFYSKCIGGGNIVYFRLSMVMFVLNMTYFMIAFGFVTLKKSTNAHPKLL